MIGFDTLKAAVRLQEEAGFNEQQARALVATFAEGIGEDMVTRGDLEKTEASLRSEIASLRGDLEKTEATLRGELQKTEAILRGEMHQLEKSISLRLGVMIGAAVGILVAVDKLF